MAISVPNFNFLALIKRVSQNLMWGLIAPYRTPYAETFMCAPSTWQNQTACQISASYLNAPCSYANMYFPYAFHDMFQKWSFWGFWGWRCENTVSYPHKALPCMNTRLLVYRMSKSFQRPKLCRSVERFCLQGNKKNWVVTLAIWGDVTPGAILTKCGLWGDIMDVIACAIFGGWRLRSVGVVRGVSLPSPIDLRCRRPLTTLVTLPCDRVMNRKHVACAKC